MTTIGDLRSFIEALREKGELAEISKEVSMEYELADVTASLSRSSGGAALFSNVNETTFPIFAGGVASHARTAISLGCEAESIIDVMGEALEIKNGIPPREVKSAYWH